MLQRDVKAIPAAAAVAAACQHHQQQHDSKQLQQPFIST
jgi:hypothetical protein